VLDVSSTVFEKESRTLKHEKTMFFKRMPQRRQHRRGVRRKLPSTYIKVTPLYKILVTVPSTNFTVDGHKVPVDGCFWFFFLLFLCV
jgi:hypothetical protein